MNKLKPCPFCGKSVAVIDNCMNIEACAKFESCDDDGYSNVVCDVNKGGCGASSGFYFDKKEAIEAWNRRANNGR